jgi:ABC-type multidrug transport system permease subunit
MSEMKQSKPTGRPPSSFKKVLVLLKYRTVAHYQDGEFLGVRFGEKIVYALLLFSLYWKIGDNLDQQSIQSTASLLFLVMTLCGFGAAAFVPILNLERPLFYRELADGMYTPIVYFANKFIEEAFIALFTSAIFTVMIYFGCALPGSFGILFISYYLTALVGIELAYFFAAAVPSLDAANTLLPLYVTMCLFFGGFFIVIDKIPVYWSWFSWTVFLRYSWGALMVDSYATSAPGQMEVFQSETGSPVTVLEFYGMSNGPIMNSVGACLAILSGLLVLFSGLCLAALTYIRHERR